MNVVVLSDYTSRLSLLPTLLSPLHSPLSLSLYGGAWARLRIRTLYSAVVGAAVAKVTHTCFQRGRIFSHILSPFRLCVILLQFTYSTTASYHKAYVLLLTLSQSIDGATVFRVGEDKC